MPDQPDTPRRSSSSHSPSSDEPSKGRRDTLKKLGGLGLGSMMLGGLGAYAPESSAAPSGRNTPAGNAERPNVIFILSDDHATSGLSCYGGDRVDTPNLDRLAEEGMRFDDCCVTNSLCAPSRATMLTGKYAHKHGVTENIYGDKEPFDNTQPTFPKMLQDAGYTTALIGKWHLRSEPTGFDYWNKLPGQGRYYDPVFEEMGERRTYDGYVSDVITDLSIGRLEEYKNQEEPFCLFSWHKAPHRGWLPGPEHEELYEDFDLPVPGTFNDDYFNRSSAAAHADMRIANMPDWRRHQPEGLTEQERKHWNYQQYAKHYYGTIASLDESVGRLLDYLDESGLAENTVVIYASDNGMFIGEHGWYDKRFMYEQSLRIPLMVRYPQEIAAGSTNDNVVMNTDFAETILDYAGVAIPAEMQGRSLRPLLQGQAPDDWRDTVYYHYYEYPGPHKVRPHYGVRGERYKLIYYYTIDEWELFDLEVDPLEVQNMYDMPAYQEVVAEMKEELIRQRHKYDDDTGAPVRG